MNTTTSTKTRRGPAVSAANKAQLRRRVEARIRELEETLSSLSAQAGNARRCSALQTELQLVTDCMSGGWNNIGEVEAAKLNQWLDNTKFLHHMPVTSVFRE